MELIYIDCEYHLAPYLPGDLFPFSPLFSLYPYLLRSTEWIMIDSHPRRHCHLGAGRQVRDQQEHP